MSLVFEALRRDDSAPPRPAAPAGSVLAGQPAVTKAGWVIGSGLLLALIGGAALQELPFGDRGRQVSAVTLNQAQAPSPHTGQGSAPGSETALPSEAEPAVVQVAELASAAAAVVPNSAAVVLDARHVEVQVTRPTAARVAAQAASPVTLAAPVVTTQVPSVSQAPAASKGALVVSQTAAAEQGAAAEPGSAPPSAAQLLSRFNEAIASDDSGKAEQILSQARDQLGAEHLLVARMEGYYCMRQNCAERARQAYGRVLQRLPQDHEAGYNLALLEVQAGRLTQARERIRTLLQVYPGDQALRDLQQAIRGRP